MKLRIVNCPDKDFKLFVQKAVEFYGQKLISKRLLDNLHLRVKFNDKLNVFASAFVTEHNASGKARVFEIEIHPWIGAKEILKALAHEMVHIKQFAYNETNDSLSRWKGIKINPDDIDYYDHPWEIEAFGLETGLFDKFATQESLWEIFEDIKDPNTPIEKKKIRWKK
mgnify:FL=1